LIISNLNLGDSLGAMTAGLDKLLEVLQRALDGEVFGIELPLIGDSLKEGAQFLERIRQDLIPALQEGLVKARILLADFEQSLPDIQAAMNWVGEQVVILKLGLYAIEIAAQRTINELITGLEAVFGGFVKFILDHLPFGVGENVRQTLAVTQKLLVSLPDVADGLNEKVLGQISPRVNEGAKHWKRSLVEPIREKALSPTGELLHQLSETNAVFSNTLQTPVKTALEQRAELRKQIETFRQAHNL